MNNLYSGLIAAFNPSFLLLSSIHTAQNAQRAQEGLVECTGTSRDTFLTGLSFLERILAGRNTPSVDSGGSAHSHGVGR